MTPSRSAGVERVSVGEIASRAGVRPSAVSNWRSRHGDFPLPVEQAAGGDLFDWASVQAWLESKGKAVSGPANESEKVLWDILAELRGEGVGVEEGVLLIMQWLFVRAAIDKRGAAERAKLENALQRLSKESGDVAGAWQQVLALVANGAAAGSRALSRPSHVRNRQLAHAVRLLLRLGDQPRDWGQVATSLLRQFEDTIGVRGSGYTPASITTLQLDLLAPVGGTMYDPAAGHAMVLAEAWRRRGGRDLRLVGQEINEYNWRIGWLHLATIGASFDFDTGDTLRDDRFRSLKAQRIAVDPPLGVRVPPEVGYGDDRWVFGLPRGSTDWLWAQHILYHLSAGGIGTMTIGVGVLSGRGPDEAIRRAIVEAGVLDAVIELPPGLIAGTSIPVAILVFARERPNRRDRVLFIDGRQLGQSRRGKLHELEPGDMRRIAAAVEAWRGGSFEDEPRFAASARAPEILADHIDLSPKRYIRYSTRVTELDGEPIAARLARLSAMFDEEVQGVRSASERAVEAIGSFEPHEAGDDWPLVRLGELLTTEPKTGSRQDPDGTDVEVPYIHTRLVSGGDGRLEQLPTEVTRGKTRGRVASRGDLLLTSRGFDAERGIACATVAFDGEAAYSESLIRLSPVPAIIDPDYLRFFLTSRQGRTALAAATTGSVIANLRPDALIEIEVRVPALAAQRAIVASMREMERALGQLNDLLSTGRDLFDTVREGVAAGLYATRTDNRS